MLNRVFLSTAALVLLGGAAHAVTFSVTNTNDSGFGSLRNAIVNVNVAGSSNGILIETTGTITLETELPALVTGNWLDLITITGPGAEQLTVQPKSGSAFRIFSTTGPGMVQVSNMTMKGDESSGKGGGISVDGGVLDLRDSVLSNGGSNIGAAISSNGGQITIFGATISGNHAGGIAYTGNDSVYVTESTLSDNLGTAIVFSPTDTAANLNINRCTISGNSSTSGVGGLQLEANTTKVIDSTFSGNSGVQANDFWTASDNVKLTLINVTTVGDNAPSLLFDHTATVTARNTIFAGTGARCSLGTHTISQGHNLATDASCALTADGDQTGIDPMLGPLANNGGPTLTHALLAGSPAIDTGGSDPTQQTVDQRKLPRVQYAVIDVGAFECTAPIFDTQPTAQTLMVGDEIMLSVTAHIVDGSTLQYQWRKDGAPIAGATSSSYSKTNAQLSDAGSYDVLVGNACDSLASTVAAVVVSSPPDLAPPADLTSAADLASLPVLDSGGCACSTHGTPHSSEWPLFLLICVAVLAYRRPLVRR